ncbi:uncharacterized protein LOC142803339 isoform X2 [Rhipicephalus microplus]|uniref:uncharacterized protein LOC142803339 isoform X2 n=1 Tax=Rhipicephalus microplus TaxID=6941 RepID=UPI003F6CB865
MGLAAPRRSKEVLRLVDTFKQLRSRRDKEWKTMFTLGLLAVLPGVVSFLLLGIFLQYAKSRDDTTRPIAATLHQQNQQFLMKQKVPRTHQLSWQKAAGLLQTCISFVKSNRTEWRLICYKP